MIDERGPVRVIMNDDPGNTPGDFACVRVEMCPIGGYATGDMITSAGPGRETGWELIGFGYVAKCRSAPSCVELVYRFGGAP